MLVFIPALLGSNMRFWLKHTFYVIRGEGGESNENSVALQNAMKKVAAESYWPKFCENGKMRLIHFKLTTIESI